MGAGAASGRREATDAAIARRPVGCGRAPRRGDRWAAGAVYEIPAAHAAGAGDASRERPFGCCEPPSVACFFPHPPPPPLPFVPLTPWAKARRGGWVTGTPLCSRTVGRAAGRMGLVGGGARWLFRTHRLYGGGVWWRVAAQKPKGRGGGGGRSACACSQPTGAPGRHTRGGPTESSTPASCATFITCPYPSAGRRGAAGVPRCRAAPAATPG